jgi:CubicO group peptidase (beta-lactamase class C family)
MRSLALKIGMGRIDAMSLRALLREVRAVLILLPLLCFTVRAQSPMPQPNAGTAVASATHSLTPDDVAPFLDGIMNIELERDDIAGAVICVVKDGRVLFEKGYGYADVAKRKPVSAQETVFRPASISKLFTATAVMQLVEQGKLDLDRDVNDYLDFRVPSKAQPVTLRLLLTHTAGFEDVFKDVRPRGPMPLALYVKSPTVQVRVSV